MMPQDDSAGPAASGMPWLAVAGVGVLSLVAFLVLHRIGDESKVRLSVMRSLAMLADSQDAYRRRHGTFATRIGAARGDSVVVLQPDGGAIITLDHADSLGWTASGTHPALTRVRTCFIYGGGIVPHDARLTKPDEPKCW